MKKILILFSTIITLFSGFAFAGGHKHDIVDTAVKAGNFNTLVAAVQAGELVETLKGKVHLQFLLLQTKHLQN